MNGTNSFRKYSERKHYTYEEYARLFNAFTACAMFKFVIIRVLLCVRIVRIPQTRHFPRFKKNTYNKIGQ